MTESKWNSIPFPIPLLTAAQDNRMLSDRKARLYLVECCRWFWDLIIEPPSRESVLVAEQFADRQADTIELKIANQLALEAFEKSPSNLALQLVYFSTERVISLNSAAMIVFDLLTFNTTSERDPRTIEKANRRLADLIREVVPYTNQPFEEAWRTKDVLELAEGMYASRQFDAMPILADMLEECGCRDITLLNHCRQTVSPHVRGCWALDAVLGKQ